MSPVPRFLIALLPAALTASPVVAQDGAEEESDWQSLFSYGSKGVQFESEDGNYFAWFGVRLQTRFATEQITQEELPDEPTSQSSDLKLNRGRFKLGGHAFTPDFTYYTEYDFPTGRLIDLRGTYKFSPWLNLRFGQWKAEFNRERRDSSGTQQFVERSVVTPWFTIDRQKGLVASGRVAAGKALDSSYWFGRLSGAGRGGSLDEADGLWFGRYQWNFTRSVLDFSQSDIGKRQEPAGSVAVAYIDGKTQYTAFSSSGGGQLPGFEGGEPDRYTLTQVVFETAYQFNGMSWQQELHWKRIQDSVVGDNQELFGGYAQFGMFPSQFWDWGPEPLELALRYAAVSPDHRVSNDYEREATFGANWFFNGHRNKLTADLSWVRRNKAPENDSRWRFRLQWDVSF